jgi:NDP-sugar pyrophosphorylase family protein
MTVAANSAPPLASVVMTLTTFTAGQSGSLPSMRAVILAGGQGSRLRPYTLVLPKPLVPVGERPILELILRQLRAGGFRHVDISVGHLGSLIQTYFGQDSNVPDGLTLEYHWEDEPLGTAGALRNIDGLSEPFLAMNGDILTDLPYAELMEQHIAGDAALTIATYRRDHQVSLGVIEHEDGAVRDYIEKPTMQYDVSMGVYAYHPRVLAHIPPGRFDFPDVVKALLAAGEIVRTYEFDGMWFDIGTPGDHERAVAVLQRDPDVFLRA